MSENQEQQHKTFRMLKRAVKEIKFESCPWHGCSWVNGANPTSLAYGTNELGTFTATSNRTGSYNERMSYLYSAFVPDSSSNHGVDFSLFSKTDTSIVLTLDLPEGVLIKPTELYFGMINGNESGTYKLDVQGFNLATNEWELIYTISKYTNDASYAQNIGFYLHSRLTAACSANNFYSKFSWTMDWRKDTKYTSYAEWKDLRITKGVMQIKK